MIITNLINAKGNAVRNQFVIVDGDTITFQSYHSRICDIREGSMGYEKVVVLGKDYNYSNTTSKHLYEFLKQNGLSILASKKDLDEALERGHARMDEAVAVWYDDTMR